MKKKRILIFSIIAVLILILIIIISRLGKDGQDSNSIYAHVVRGPFTVSVTTSGELEAKNSVKVFGPQNLRKARVWNIKIADIVAEGTSVSKGDYIAQLDRTEVAEALKNAELELENKTLELTQAKIDTTIEMQQARNNLENLQSTMLEKKLEVEKSIYEPPVIQKQTEAEYIRAKRNYEQAVDEYSLKITKASTKIRGSSIRLQKTKQHVNLLKDVLNELTITAPEDGMVIYKRDRRGEKTAKGSMMNTWQPIVAELPDLNILISKTFVNEVDIRKVKINQKVEITFDAFPGKKMTGKVIAVANVGETIFGGKAKVFRVDILLNGTDKDIKPAMTTGNTIITSHSDNALSLPIESVYSQGDSLNYVFLQKKFSTIKKQVLLGERNDLNVVISEGLIENDKVFFLPPKNSSDLEFAFLDAKTSIAKTQTTKEN